MLTTVSELKPIAHSECSTDFPTRQGKWVLEIWDKEPILKPGSTEIPINQIALSKNEAYCYAGVSIGDFQLIFARFVITNDVFDILESAKSNDYRVFIVPVYNQTFEQNN